MHVMQNKVPNQFLPTPIKLCALHSHADLQTGKSFGRNIENSVLRRHQRRPGIIDHWYAKFISGLQLNATKDNPTEKKNIKKKETNCFHNLEFIKCLLNNEHIPRPAWLPSAKAWCCKSEAATPKSLNYPEHQRQST